VGDFVYFDPPYALLSPTANFTAYHASGFSADDQQRLWDVCWKLTKRNVSIMVSNSDTEFIRTLYSGRCFTISEVLANRAINRNGGKRGKITEVIITNYPPERFEQLRLFESHTSPISLA
jgi:DNA adenine methylase